LRFQRSQSHFFFAPGHNKAMASPGGGDRGARLRLDLERYLGGGATASSENALAPNGARGRAAKPARREDDLFESILHGSHGDATPGADAMAKRELLVADKPRLESNVAPRVPAEPFTTPHVTRPAHKESANAAARGSPRPHGPDIISPAPAVRAAVAATAAAPSPLKKPESNVPLKPAWSAAVAQPKYKYNQKLIEEWTKLVELAHGYPDKVCLFGELGADGFSIVGAAEFQGARPSSNKGALTLSGARAGQS